MNVFSVKEASTRNTSYLWVAVLAFLTIALVPLLVACSDNSTSSALSASAATPVPTTATATTPAATTATVTAATTSTAAPTTANPTIAVTTPAATTPAATTVASSTKADIPAISGLKEVELEQATQDEFILQIPGLSRANAAVKFYVSDDQAEQTAGSVDSALIKAGYKFGVPGQEKPNLQGDPITGLYSKSGQADLLVATVKIPANVDERGLELLNVNLNKFGEQLKGKKSAVFILVAPQLLQRLNGNAPADPNTSATPGAQLREFVSQPGKFSIMLPLPGVPKITDQNWIQLSEGSLGTPGSSLTYEMGTSRSDGIIIWIGFVDFEPDYVAQHGPAQLFDNERSKIEQLTGVDFKSEKDLKLADKYSGKEYQYTVSGFGGIVQRYYLVNNRLYTIVVAAVLGGFPRYTLQMLDSFKVTP